MSATTLIECHAHMVLTGGDWKAAMGRHVPKPNEAEVRRVLREYAEAGVEYVRDGGDKHGASLMAQRLAPEYGIEYVSPAWPLSREGSYGSFIGKTYTSLDDAKVKMEQAAEAGARFIKFMFSGILDFNEFGVITSEPRTFEQMCSLVEYAHGMGMPVMAHTNGAAAVKNAALAGVDSIEHGFYADEDALQAMLRMNTIWVPTLSPVCNLFDAERFPRKVLKQIAHSQDDALNRAADMGIPIACGSDAGAACVPHVQGAVDEMHHLQHALRERTAEVVEAGNARIRARF